MVPQPPNLVYTRNTTECGPQRKTKETKLWTEMVHFYSIVGICLPNKKLKDGMPLGKIECSRFANVSPVKNRVAKKKKKK